MIDPPRSVLFVPASRPRMLARAAATGADAWIVDLEDAVAPEEKERAREHLRAAVAREEWPRDVPWMLRVNPPGSPWHDEDLRLARELRPARIVLPKAEDPGAVRAAGDAAADHGSGVALMIETARGVARVEDLAGCHPGVEMLVVGSADLRLSLTAPADPGRTWERHALATILLAARSHGAVAVDGVFFRYRDRAGLEADARVARALGYDGKSCIHPDQVETIHAVFASTAEEASWAEAVLRAWRQEDGNRRGVVAMDGEMIEALHVRLAERIRRRS